MILGDLSGNPANPRKISEQEKAQLKESLQQFGDLSGVIFNETTNHLVGGHMRKGELPPNSEIVIEERLPQPSRTGTTARGHIIVDGEKFVYRQVRWDENKERIATIAANKIGGEWDLPKLADWLLDLDAKNLDIKLTGFTAPEMEELCAPLNFTEPDEKSDPAMRDAELKTCPNCGVLIGAE